MTNLNQLQSELAALTERVNSAMAITEGSITLTREQLKQLINKVQEQTKEWIENEVDDMRFDEDDFIDLDLNGREIDLNFNEDQLRREIKGNIGGPEDINDDELDTLLNEIKEA
jgi:uncharacterized coiled-coil protein SlyX